MDFTLVRGRPFQQHFDFKSQSGREILTPTGNYRLVLEHGDYAKEYTINNGLKKLRGGISWTVPVVDGENFEYTTMYYTLYLDSSELARGILRIQ